MKDFDTCSRLPAHYLVRFGDNCGGHLGKALPLHEEEEKDMKVLVLLAHLMGWTFQDVTKLKEPCPDGFVSVYMEVYADKERPFRVTEKRFLCIKDPRE